MTIQPSPFLEKCSNSTITFIINAKKIPKKKFFRIYMFHT